MRISIQNQEHFKFFAHRIKNLIAGFLLLSSMLFFASPISGQNEGNENAADRTLRGNGRVNASTLAMEFDLPLASYPGRGINVPIGLSYSSKLWRMKSLGRTPVPAGNSSPCYDHYLPLFAEDTASGWTTSLAVPFIEYTGMATFYDNDGSPITFGDSECPSTQGTNETFAQYYIKRILVHLPSGETHELRASDSKTMFLNWSDSNAPDRISNWNETYYAADGSNIVYVQNSNTGTYRLLMPDGSYYDFDGSTQHGEDRKATKFTDRNGNFTTYYGPGSVDNNGVTHPNGYWKDTLGRNLSVPVGLSPPSTPTTASQPQIYSVPGLGGTSSVQYKLHWKQLKGANAAESALTNFSDQLRYLGNRYNGAPGACGNSLPAYCNHPAESYLFGDSNSVIVSNSLFNPILLSEIELPTGQKYKFSYDVFGRINKISYPTGGEEVFTYNVVPTLSVLEPGSIGAQSNFGVTNRKVYASSGGAFYEWTYAATYVQPKGYKVTIVNPDNTTVERFLHRGYDSGSDLGKFGYDNGLSGMQYEQRSYDKTGTPVSRSLTHWTTSQYSGSAAPADWHPRVTHNENYIFDPNGSGEYLWSTTRFEYEDLSGREKPVLRNKTLEYGFQSGGSSSNLIPEGGSPDPNPTPVPTPVPPNLLRTSETVYFIYDSNIPQTTRDQYYSIANLKNISGMVSASVAKDASGTVVSRSEMKYDDPGYSPSNFVRANPTRSRVWDSTKGVFTDSNSYIETKARFDDWGNQYESIDARGNSTTTTFDSTHHAFPIQVTSAVPDPTGQKGSNTAFITTTTFDVTTGLPLKTKDANELETHIEYDPVTLRPIKIRMFYQESQVGSMSETIYHDEANNYWVKNRSQIDETNWAESITYFDGLGRAYRAEQVDSDGNIFVDKEFDADGRVLRVSNPYRANETKVWTTNVYDDASRVIEVILPDGAKVKTDYAVSTTGIIGVSKQVTDQAGKKRKGISDSLGRMVRVIEDPAGQNLATDYVFDTLGNLRKTIQGSQSRFFSYDSLGRLLRAKQPEQEVNTGLAMATADAITGNNQWSVSYEYDDNGNITKTTDAKGVHINATYDRFNRLTYRNYSDSTPDVDFYYDGTGLGGVPNFSKGKTTKITNGISETRYNSFDMFGRLLTHEQRTTPEQLAGTAPAYATSYIYNLSGALIEETYPSGRKVKNTLDQDGELALVQSRKNANYGFVNYASAIKYNSSGAVEKIKLGNGHWETAQYNNRLQVTQMGLGVTDSDQNLLKLEFGYGTNTQNNGSMRSQKISFSGLSQAFEQTYAYDDLNRLQSAEEKISGATNWRQTFQYDRFGNRRFDAANTTTLLQSNNITNPTIDIATNRFSAGQNYAYDKNGNLTNDAEGRKFFYDAENHQTEVQNSANQQLGLYQYDGEGRRVKKISSTETTIFVYNAGGTLVAEYSTALAQTQQVSYLTQDHLGSPRVITNENGAVTTRQDFAAFGDETLTAQRTQGLGYKPDSIRQDYTGYQKDEESGGLEFAQARYYNTKHGRFTSIDPLTASANVKDPQTFNRYSYAMNSPYKFTDPLGLISEDTGACGSSCLNSGPMNGGYQMEMSRFTAFASSYSLDQPDGSVVFNDAVIRFLSGSPTPGSSQDEVLKQFERAQKDYPVFNSTDQKLVDEAVADAEKAVSDANFSNKLIEIFRPSDNSTTPAEALEKLNTNGGIQLIRDSNGNPTGYAIIQNVFDGRNSSLLIEITYKGQTQSTSVKLFFENNKSIGALIHRGRILLSSHFFINNAVGRAKMIIHEAIIHKAFNRSDLDFGDSVEAGSNRINEKLSKYYDRIPL